MQVGNLQLEECENYSSFLTSLDLSYATSFLFKIFPPREKRRQDEGEKKREGGGVRLLFGLQYFWRNHYEHNK